MIRLYMIFEKIQALISVMLIHFLCQLLLSIFFSEREEEKLKNNNRDLFLVKMKSMFAIGFAFTALLSTFNSIFDGRVVAKLPFVPISWIQGLSHRNLPGEDYTDCSFIFLYILCTMSIRQNIQKLLGFAPSRTASKQSGTLFSPGAQQIK
ncbi:calcium load-activated calcium channel-like [Limulus polyphemus]|uniref:Calcium load-activated calcium channel-like n=1 Tax=Limulus polyphemus TaxID=6850 RepID=A0ABM1B5L0_LIMPO|nr:calcium load-activated calcium channel-like [Limulus polyphemus]